MNENKHKNKMSRAALTEPSWWGEGEVREREAWPRGYLMVTWRSQRL